jgi:group I intron endonuclease
MDYANGQIYKIVNNVDDKIYVGSTCTILAKRKVQHKAKAKIYPDRTLYAHCNVVGWTNVQIILVEAFPCANKQELQQRERYWIDQLKPVLNVSIPTRTRQEHYLDNKDKTLADRKIEYQQNKQKILDRVNAYQIANRDEISQKRKERYRKNKEAKLINNV